MRPNVHTNTHKYIHTYISVKARSTRGHNFTAYFSTTNQCQQMDIVDSAVFKEDVIELEFEIISVQKDIIGNDSD